MILSKILHRAAISLASETSIFRVQGPEPLALSVLPFDPYEYIAGPVLARAEQLKPQRFHSSDVLTRTPCEREDNVIELRHTENVKGAFGRGMGSLASEIHEAMEVKPIQNMIMQVMLQDLEGTPRKAIVIDIMGLHPGHGSAYLGQEGKEGYMPFEIPHMTMNIDLFEGRTFPRDVAVGKMRHMETGLRKIYDIKRTPGMMAGYCGQQPPSIESTKNIFDFQG